MNIRAAIFDEPYGWTPVKWAKFRISRKIISSILPISKKPILLISMPRSGSSWIGEMLACAPNVAYLREPMTQTMQRAREPHSGSVTVFVDEDNPDADYMKATERAFSGVPIFPNDIIRSPERWGVFDRTAAVVLIKEVNPLCLDWVLSRFSPKVVFLVRHPAAVALSRWKKGWGTINERQRRVFHPSLLERFPDVGPLLEKASDFWEYEGVRQRMITQYSIEILKKHGDYMIARYEDICGDPQTHFRELYKFLDLEMTTKCDNIIKKHSRPSGKKESSSTIRESEKMIYSFFSEMKAENIRALRNFYLYSDALYGENHWVHQTPS